MQPALTTHRPDTLPYRSIAIPIGKGVSGVCSSTYGVDVTGPSETQSRAESKVTVPILSKSAEQTRLNGRPPTFHLAGAAAKRPVLLEHVGLYTCTVTLPGGTL